MTPDVRALMVQIRSAGWLLKEDYTVKYTEIQTNHFDKLQKSPEKLGAAAKIIHRVDAVFKILYKGSRSNKI